MSFGNEREFIDYLQRKEGKTMKCPLARVSVGWRGNTEVIEHPDCIKEECACWDKELGRCDPTGLIRPLIRLVEELEEIKKKMPHELQFRK